MLLRSASSVLAPIESMSMTTVSASLLVALFLIYCDEGVLPWLYLQSYSMPAYFKFFEALFKTLDLSAATFLACGRCLKAHPPYNLILHLHVFRVCEHGGAVKYVPASLPRPAVTIMVRKYFT